jgi:hypothetical protein
MKPEMNAAVQELGEPVLDCASCSGEPVSNTSWTENETEEQEDVLGTSLHSDMGDWVCFQP